MDDTSKDQSSVSGSKVGGSAKLLRYPLRSSTKSKEDKPPLSSPSTTSASRRGKRPSIVSQSISVLDASAKDKSAKPPRRYSIPTKSTPTPSPVPKPANNITPRASRSRNSEGTPVSDVSRSSTRKKFSVLSSASYWLSQIKLSEAAGKHQVSLGFFKLAQEATCENIQLLRDELKSYTLRHNIGESAKEVLESYEISETIENVPVSEQGSEDAQSLSSVNGIQKPKPRSSNNLKENNSKKLISNTKPSTIKKTANQLSGKMQKITKESNKGKQIVKSKEGKKPASEGVVSSLTEEAITQDNKENMDAPPAEEFSLEA